MTRGFFVSNQYVIIPIDLNYYAKSYSSWIATFAGFVLFTGLIILSTGEIRVLLSKKISELEVLNKKLQDSYDEINTLQGILPICSGCGKIRDGEGYWNQVEAYIEKHSSVTFSHALCQPCGDKYYGNQEWYKKVRKDTCPN